MKLLKRIMPLYLCFCIFSTFYVSNVAFAKQKSLSLVRNGEMIRQGNLVYSIDYVKKKILRINIKNKKKDYIGTKKEGIKDLFVCGKYLYINVSASSPDSRSHVWRMNLDNLEEEKLFKGCIVGLINKKIYYNESSEGPYVSTIYTCNLNGENSNYFSNKVAYGEDEIDYANSDAEGTNGENDILCIIKSPWIDSAPGKNVNASIIIGNYKYKLKGIAINRTNLKTMKTEKIYKCPLKYNFGSITVNKYGIRLIIEKQLRNKVVSKVFYISLNGKTKIRLS